MIHLESRNCLVFFFGVLILFTGCKKQEITYYEIPKEALQNVVADALPEGHPPVASEARGSAGGMQQAQALPGVSTQNADLPLAWVVPNAWVEGAPSSVRLASFGLNGVSKGAFDVSITRFPGDVGGVFSNVNRWRGQIGLERLSNPLEIESLAEVFNNDHFEFQIFKMSNGATPAMATEVAILQLDGFSWFFKMTGTLEITQLESGHFRELLNTVHPSDLQSS